MDEKPNMTLSIKDASTTTNADTDRGSILWQNTGAFYISRFFYDGSDDSFKMNFGNS